MKTPSLLSLAAALLLSAAVTLLPAPTAHALSCGPITLHSQYTWADVVVVGRVVSFDREYSVQTQGPVVRPSGAPVEGHEAAVAVERYLKGTGPEVMTVVSLAAQWGRSWRESDVGERWLFFLKREADGVRYIESACSGSGPLTAGSVAGMALASLLSPLVLGVAALGLVAGGVFWTWRVMRRWEAERGDGAR